MVVLRFQDVHLLGDGGPPRSRRNAIVALRGFFQDFVAHGQRFFNAWFVKRLGKGLDRSCTGSLTVKLFKIVLTRYVANQLRHGFGCHRFVGSQGAVDGSTLTASKLFETHQVAVGANLLSKLYRWCITYRTINGVNDGANAS